MPFCILCNELIIGAPALVAYPSEAPIMYYCEACAAKVFEDACVGSMIRIHDKEKYDSIRESSHVLGLIAAGLMANDKND